MINFAKKNQHDIIGQTAMNPYLQAVTVEIQFFGFSDFPKLKHHLLSLLFLNIFFNILQVGQTSKVGREAET